MLWGVGVEGRVLRQDSQDFTSSRASLPTQDLPKGSIHSGRQLAWCDLGSSAMFP